MPRKKYDIVEKGRMLYDPNDTSLYNKLKKYGEFDFDSLTVNPFQLCRYIVLMYDVESPLKLEYLDLWERKRAAAELAGFKQKKDGKFEEEVEKLLIGENMVVNTAVAKYVMLFGLPEIPSLEAAQAAMFFEVAKTLKGDFNKNTIQNIAFLRSEIKSLTEVVFGGQEPLNAKKALYGMLEDKRKSIRPEDVIKRISEGDKLDEWSPYGKNYNADELTYGGDE